MSSVPFKPADKWCAYQAVISNQVFDCVTPETSVLEIGPFHGAFTDLLLAKNPRHLQLIEPNQFAFTNLTKKYSACRNVAIRNDNVFDILNQPQVEQFDVVVAFGVLYHWHNTFDFFERVANLVKPLYFCVDSPGSSEIYISREKQNELGSRQVSVAWRSVKFSLVWPADYIETAMDDLGYLSDFHRSMADIDLDTKNTFNVWKFRLDDSLRQR